MAHIAAEAGSGGTTGLNPLAQSADAWVEALVDIVGESGRKWTVTVTDTAFQASNGFVSASLGESEILVIVGKERCSAGDVVIVSKYDNSNSSPYVLELLTAQAAEGAEYGLSFTSPTTGYGAVRVAWGGEVLAIFTHGTGSFGLSIGGSAVGIGSVLGSGDWLDVALTGGAGNSASIAVIVG